MRHITKLTILCLVCAFLTPQAMPQRQQTPQPGQTGQGQRDGATPPARQPVQPGQVNGTRPALDGPLPSSPRFVTVTRGDTGKPMPGVVVRPKPLDVPNAFDKPCKAKTVTDVSEGPSAATDANGRFPVDSTLAPGYQFNTPAPVILDYLSDRRVLPQVATPPAATPEDETARRIVEMERLRRLADSGVPAVAQERLDRVRIPQATIDLITAAATVPLAARKGVKSALIAEHEGFVQAPWDNLTLLPAPTLSGRIVDANNKPVAGAVVQAYEVRFRPLGRTMKWVKSTLTNDLGEYRLSWLPYGWYTIAAGYSTYVQQAWMEGLQFSPNMPDPDTGLPLLFYPGVENSADAGLIHIKPPAQADEGLPAPVANLALQERPRFNVRVRLVAEKMPANPNLVVVPAGGDVCASMDFAIQGNPDGTFDVRNLPRGRYEMVAIRGKDVISALMPVKVEQDIDELKLAVTNPVTVQGTVTFEGLPPGTDFNLLLGEIRVSLTRSRSEVSQVATSVADPLRFNFSIPGVGPGFYYPTVTLPPGAYVKDIHVMGVHRAPAGAEDDWTCDALPTGTYSYLDTHGHLEPLEIPRDLATGNLKEFLCLKIDIRFDGQMAGIAWTWTPCMPRACQVPRGLNPGMAVLMPRSAWQRFNDNGVTPPDRILVVDASGGRYEFHGVPMDDYRLYAVEYPNAELIYRREFNEWFAATATPLLFDFVTPCPVESIQKTCDVIAPAQTTVNGIVP